MKKSEDYNKVYEVLQFILNRKSIITDSVLEKIIEETKLLSPESFDISSELNEKDWENIKIDLKKYFNIKMDKAIFLKGVELQEKNSTWWTDTNGSLENFDKNFYWKRYKKYLESSIFLSKEVINTIDNDTNQILNNLGNPNEIGKFTRYGLVIGQVQSGKTLNYSAVINKATDAGYKFIVVIAGGLENLRNQTQERLIETFVGYNKEKSKSQVGVGIDDDNFIINAPTVLTQSTKDFQVSYTRQIDYHDFNKPILVVIKKNTKILENLNKWLEKVPGPIITDRSLLVIDDECDYASINTNEENDPTKINKEIRNLLSKFEKSSYVAYTATPYANILINYEAENKEIKDLFPRDFICTLKTPTNYFGPEEVFINNPDKYLISIDTCELEDFLPKKHKKDFIITKDLPTDMQEAIFCFYLNIAIRHLRNQENKHNSMLIHISRLTKIHEMIFKKVEIFNNLIGKHLNLYILDLQAEAQSDIIKKMETLFKEKYNYVEFSWEEIKISLSNICKKVGVYGEYLGSNNRVNYNTGTIKNAIVIGGMSLSRGFTLEGLTISYFSRTTIFYDTLMQMARWFGYRDKYSDLCKIYLPDNIKDNFIHIHQCTEDLLERIKIMNYERKSPEEFGLYIKKHPTNSLQITARNKQKNSQDYEFIIDYQGKLKETLFIKSDDSINEKNKNLIIELVNSLGKSFEVISNTYVWKKQKTILGISLIEKFETTNLIMTNSISEYNKDFLKAYLNDFSEIDIALYNGRGNLSGDLFSNIEIKYQQRNVSENKIENIYKLHKGGRLSSGGSEAIILDKNEKDEVEKIMDKDSIKVIEIRKKLKRPLLMLHIIQKNDSDLILAGYGLSFPSISNSPVKNYKVKLNTVLINELLTQKIEEDNFSDD